jgi:CheY-like chemotaxis protein
MNMNVKTVLVIDDNKRTRESLRILMEFEGFIVDCCASGPSACERLMEMCFDVILIDYRIPEMLGTEVASWARRLCPDALIIGMSIEIKRQEFMSAGANDFIAKERLVQDLPLMVKGEMRQ